MVLVIALVIALVIVVQMKVEMGFWGKFEAEKRLLLITVSQSPKSHEPGGYRRPSLAQLAKQHQASEPGVTLAGTRRGHRR